MSRNDQNRFNRLYQQRLDAIILQGRSPKTQQMYSHYLQQTAEFFDRCPDHLTAADLKAYFLHLVESRSWSTVKVARNAIQFFYRFVLNRPWDRIPIVKPPKVQPLQDVLSMEELNLIINRTRKLSYQVYFLTTYSLGLRLSETLNLQVGDVDGRMMRVHIRRSKGNAAYRHPWRRGIPFILVHKDRFVPLPHLTQKALRCNRDIHLYISISLAKKLR